MCGGIPTNKTIKYLKKRKKKHYKCKYEKIPISKHE